MVSADASPATTTALTWSAHCGMASTSASTKKPACACDLRCISAQSESPSEVAVASSTVGRSPTRRSSLLTAGRWSDSSARRRAQG